MTPEASRALERLTNAIETLNDFRVRLGVLDPDKEIPALRADLQTIREALEGERHEGWAAYDEETGRAAFITVEGEVDELLAAVERDENGVIAFTPRRAALLFPNSKEDG